MRTSRIIEILEKKSVETKIKKKCVQLRFQIYELDRTFSKGLCYLLRDNKD